MCHHADVSLWDDPQMSEEQRRQTVELLTAFLRPWHVAVEAPGEAQRKVLDQLLRGYARTEYGRTHRAEQVRSINEPNRKLTG